MLVFKINMVHFFEEENIVDLIWDLLPLLVSFMEFAHIANLLQAIASVVPKFYNTH